MPVVSNYAQHRRPDGYSFSLGAFSEMWAVSLCPRERGKPRRDRRLSGTDARCYAMEENTMPYMGGAAAEIGSLARLSFGQSPSVVKTGRLAVDLSARTVEVDGCRVQLSRKEFAVLELLSLQKGITLTTESFMDWLYGRSGEAGPKPKIVTVFICKLRKKLSAAGGHKYIATLRGGGYVLRDPPANSD